MPRHYLPQELEKLLSELDSEKPIFEVAYNHDRSPYGIALKLRQLSRKCPSVWDLENIGEYTRREIKKHGGDRRGQKKRWKARQRGGLQRSPQYTKLKINRERFRKYIEDILCNYDTQNEFASEIGIHPSSLSHYLSGRTIPSVENLKKMSKVFGVPYEKFLEDINRCE